jgi:predicted transcriptional regulator
MDRTGSADVVRLLLRRSTLLARLSTEPATKRDLVEQLDVSRSTVDRAVRELAEVRLVDRGPDGVALTLPGRLALETFRECLDVTAGVVEAAPMLEALSRDTGIDPAMLQDPRVVGTEQHTPQRPVDEFTSLVQRADVVRCVLAAYVPEHVTACCERAADHDLDAEIVFAKPVLSSLTPDAETALRRAARGTLSAYRLDDTAPYSLVVAEDGDAVRAGVLVADDSGVRGFVSNDDPAAVSWADREFDRWRSSATPASF